MVSERRQNAGAVAKRRLQLVFVISRLGLAPDPMDVVSKYFEGDQDTTEFNVERSDEPIALISSIGVKRVRRRWDDATDPTLSE